MIDSFKTLIRMTEAHLEGLRETDPRSLDLAPNDLAGLTRPGKTIRPSVCPAAAAPAPPTRDPDAARRLQDIAARISVCTQCPLHRTRTRTVPGQGCATPEILFVGEGPGREEDRQGLAFVGQAGALLTRLISRMGLTRDEVFIGNVVKCRPTVDGLGVKDRAPDPEEAHACLPYLREQIAALRPRVIVTLGNVSLEALTGKRGITRVRGQWLNFESVDLMPTFHPSYLLRTGGDDKARYWEVWEDMCEVLKRLGRPMPKPAAKHQASSRSPYLHANQPDPRFED